MLSQPQRDLFGYASVYLFIGGYGFLLFVYPETALRIIGQTPTPNQIKLAKASGGHGVGSRTFWRLSVCSLCVSLNDCHPGAELARVVE